MFNVLYQTIKLPDLSLHHQIPLQCEWHITLQYHLSSKFGFFLSYYKFDHEILQVLLSPWMEISPIPDILPEILNQGQTECCPHPYPEEHLHPSPSPDTLKELWPFPRFQQSWRMLHPELQVLQPNSAIVSTHSPDSDTHLGCCGSWRGSSLPQTPWRVIPYISGQMWTVMRDRKPLVPPASQAPRGFQPGWKDGWDQSAHFIAQ